MKTIYKKINRFSCLLAISFFTFANKAIAKYSNSDADEAFEAIGGQADYLIEKLSDLGFKGCVLACIGFTAWGMFSQGKPNYVLIAGFAMGALVLKYLPALLSLGQS